MVILNEVSSLWKMLLHNYNSQQCHRKSYQGGFMTRMKTSATSNAPQVLSPTLESTVLLIKDSFSYAVCAFCKINVVCWELQLDSNALVKFIFNLYNILLNFSREWKLGISQE